MVGRCGGRLASDFLPSARGNRNRCLTFVHFNEHYDGSWWNRWPRYHRRCNFDNWQQRNAVADRWAEGGGGWIPYDGPVPLEEDFVLVPSSRRRAAITHHRDMTRPFVYHDGQTTVGAAAAGILSLALENSCAAFPGRLLPRVLARSFIINNVMPRCIPYTRAARSSASRSHVAAPRTPPSPRHHHHHRAPPRRLRRVQPPRSADSRDLGDLGVCSPRGNGAPSQRA